MAGRGSRPGERRGGRQPGTPNKRTLDGEAYAKGIVEDPKGYARLLKDFQHGALPAQVYLHLLQMAYGKPTEVIVHANSDGEGVTTYILTPVQVQSNGHAVSAPDASGDLVSCPPAL